ncbi:hypothetical protein BRC81_06270 [Halobacteriales archaeon QS_1_68_20]|nr:MAG: hypothetical protein BRC81_06270 [Halobacteriales archaeon QS_1_68_20]
MAFVSENRRTLAGLVIVAVAAVASALAAPELPEQVTTHWNAAGEPDGFMGATTVLVGAPALILGVVVLFEVIPGIDPLGENVREFQTAYDALAVLTAGFLAYTYGFVLAWNLGYQFEVMQALAPAMAVLYVAVGYLLERAERNWFVGIRTPWTLSSETVWRHTHERAAPLFKLAGVLALGALVLPDYAVYFLVGPVVAVAGYATVYSYVDYRRLGDGDVADAAE